eukprot:7239125-Lingulodinium_polyedra.AAC.1
MPRRPGTAGLCQAAGRWVAGCGTDAVQHRHRAGKRASWARGPQASREVRPAQDGRAHAGGLGLQ